jgi:uncharacterized protein
MANQHRFVWHDLNAQDIEAEKKFYGELFGWTFEKSDDGRYEHIKAGHEMIGGIHHLEAASKSKPHWLGYVAVDDMQQTAKEIESHQGKLHRPPKELNVGTFAVAQDPTGGYFAPWKTLNPEDEMERQGDAPPMTFIWDELVSTNPDKALKFYADVFGWEPQPFGPDYAVLRRPGTTSSKGQPKGAGGVLKATEDHRETYWMPYISVEDPDAIVEKARQLGATIETPPTDLPQVGRYSVITDPQGAHIAVMKPTP